MSGQNAEKRRKKEVKNKKGAFEHYVIEEVKESSSPSELRSCLMTSAVINSKRAKRF